MGEQLMVLTLCILDVTVTVSLEREVAYQQVMGHVLLEFFGVQNFKEYQEAMNWYKPNFQIGSKHCDTSGHSQDFWRNTC